MPKCKQETKKSFEDAFIVFVLDHSVKEKLKNFLRLSANCLNFLGLFYPNPFSLVLLLLQSGLFFFGTFC